MRQKTCLSLLISILLATISIIILFNIFGTWSIHAKQEEEIGLFSNPTSGWENQGLFGAPVNIIKIDSENNAVYACTSGLYPLYKTDITTDTWQAVNSIWGSCSAFDLDTINNRIYVIKDGQRLIRSDDLGFSWNPIFSATEITDGNFSFFLDSFLIAPDTPETLYLGTQGGELGGTLFRSIDAGETWEQSQWYAGTSWNDFIDSGISYIAVDPTVPNIVFAATSSFQITPYNGIYRSMDGGQSFYHIVTDTLGAATIVGVSANGTVYASFDGFTWRSFDKGGTWDKILDQDTGEISYHPTFSDTVWLHNYKCIENGDSCELTHLLSTPIVHPVVTYTMYIKTPYGIQKTVDGGNSWSDHNDGLEEVSIWQVTVDPGDQNRYFVATGGAVGYTEDGGENWLYPIPGMGDSFFDIVINPENPDMVFATPNGGATVYRSEDNGVSWSSNPIHDDLSLHTGIRKLSLDPTNSQIGYIAVSTIGPPIAGHWGGVYKSIDSGVTWISTTLRNIPINTVISISDTLTHTLLAGANNTPDGQLVGGIYISLDGAVTWSRSGLNGIPIQDIVSDPRFPSILYAGTNDGIYKSEDSGQGWDQVLPIGSIWDIAIDPENPDFVYAIVNADIYRSPNAGMSWDQIYQHIETDGVPSDLHIPWLPPSSVVSFTAIVSDPTHVILNWLNPNDSDFMGTQIRYLTTTFPTRYSEGILVTDQQAAPGHVTSFTHTILISSTTIFYSAFTYDSDGYFAINTPLSVTLDTTGTFTMQPNPLYNNTQIDYPTTNYSEFYLGNSRGLYRVIVKDKLSILLPLIVFNEKK